MINLIAKLNAGKFIQSVEEAQMRAGFAMLEKLLDITEPSIPVDTGRMKSSSTVQRALDIIYAGYNTEYAWVNHQGIDKNGNKINRNSGKDFWFARTIEANREQLKLFYEEQLHKNLKKVYDN